MAVQAASLGYSWLSEFNRFQFISAIATDFYGSYRSIDRQINASPLLLELIRKQLRLQFLVRSGVLCKQTCCFFR
jgi:hypothetical protein